MARTLAVVVLAILVGCSAAAAPPSTPRNPGQTDTCDPHPTGLPGSFVVKFDAGFDYQPEGGNIQPRILDDFLYAFHEALVGSAFQFTETQGTDADIHVFVSVMNDGANNFHVVVNAAGAGTPSPGYLFVYTQSMTYTSAVQALTEAAFTVAGYFTSGWTCT